jgi:hypothetical protein
VRKIARGVEDNLVRYYNCLSEELEVIQDGGYIEKADHDEVGLFTEMLQEHFSDISSPPIDSRYCAGVQKVSRGTSIANDEHFLVF